MTPDAAKALRAQFAENEIGLLPKPIKKTQQGDPRFKCVEGNPEFRNASVDGKACGGYHVPSVHLEYVGHAAVTDRLLKADPEWSWEPIAFGDDGLPVFDRNGGLWIRLTVAGVTRLGYGDAQGKTGPNATKEAIGDALRNAAMRFGVALDLWHKGDLVADDDPTSTVDFVGEAETAPSMDAIRAIWSMAKATKADRDVLDQIMAIGASRFPNEVKQS